MCKVIICRGIPASGKSYFAKNWVNEDSVNRVRINMDDIRNMLGPYWVPTREKLVGIIKDNAILEAVRQNYDIVIDNNYILYA